VKLDETAMLLRDRYNYIWRGPSKLVVTQEFGVSLNEEMWAIAVFQ
jgi:hypothetical protein